MVGSAHSQSFAFCGLPEEFVGDVSGNVIGLKTIDLTWDMAGGAMKMKEVPGISGQTNPFGLTDPVYVHLQCY